MSLENIEVGILFAPIIRFRLNGQFQTNGEILTGEYTAEKRDGHIVLLGTGGEGRDQSKEWRANFHLSPKQRRKGKDLLRAASLLLFCFPGSPTVYYGDEAGMEGFEDPFNRQTYPWGHEDRELLDWFRALGRLRKEHPALRRGDIRYVCGKGPLLAFARSGGGETVLCAFNAGEDHQALRAPGLRVHPDPLLAQKLALDELERQEKRWDKEKDGDRI